MTLPANGWTGLIYSFTCAPTIMVNNGENGSKVEKAVRCRQISRIRQAHNCSYVSYAPSPSYSRGAGGTYISVFRCFCSGFSSDKHSQERLPKEDT